MTGSAGEDVWRRETPHVLSALVRRYGDFAACEDAVQDALLEASQKWPVTGMPSRPRGWLLRVASRRLIDSRRRDSARLERERRVAVSERVDSPAVLEDLIEQQDASLQVLSLCCHPELSSESQVTLALRAVIGLTTKQIAAVLLIPSATAGQRISRAKTTIAQHGKRLPSPARVEDNLPALMHVLYLTYTTGHSLPAGGQLLDSAITAEAIRLARQLHRWFPDEPEATGLLALMLLTEARRPARTTPSGDLIRLKDQDRSLWNREIAAWGTALVERALPTGPVGAYQLQAAIAAVHAEAPTWESTDWAQIAELYAMLSRVAPSPSVMLNYAVAVGEARGPDTALRMTEPLLGDPQLNRTHRVHAVRAALLEASGRGGAALDEYRAASALCASIPEQRFLNAQITRLTQERG